MARCVSDGKNLRDSKIMFRIPIFDFDLTSYSKEGEKQGARYVTKVTPPENFDRPHIAALNLEKIVQEFAIDVNLREGMENENFDKKLLGELYIRCTREVTDFRNLILALTRTEIKERGGTVWHKWEFDFCEGAMIGYFWACYKYTRQL